MIQRNSQRLSLNFWREKWFQYFLTLSIDQIPPEYFLFPKLKMKIKNQKEVIIEIKIVVRYIGHWASGG